MDELAHYPNLGTFEIGVVIAVSCSSSFKIICQFVALPCLNGAFDWRMSTKRDDVYNVPRCEMKTLLPREPGDHYQEQ